MPASHLRDNLQALRTVGSDPLARASTVRKDTYVLDHPDGSLRLRTRDGRSVRMESAREPRREAEALVDAALAAGTAPAVAILGVGAVALLESVVSRGLRALVIEFDAELASAWLSRRSWVELIAANRLRVIVGPDYVGSAEAARFVEGLDRIPVIAHPVLLREYPDEMAAARRALDRVVRDSLANANARQRFEDLALVNTLRNLPALVANADVQSLFGRFTRTPAVVVGAGPSLDENLDAVRDSQDRAIVIAADTALLPCLKAGVVPHLVVALDPSQYNGRHLAACRAATETHLVTEPSVDPSGVEAFAGRTFGFRVGDHAPWPFLLRAGIGRGQLTVWGSVVTAALDLALKAGCPLVTFVGLDLAYTGGRPYARGTVFEDPWAWAVAEGRPLEEHWDIQLKNRPVIEVPDVHGRPTPSAEHLLAFRDWIREVAAAQPGVRFVNATNAGILGGPHIAQEPLESVLREHPAVGRAALASAVRGAWESSVDGTVGGRLAARFGQARPLDVVAGHSAPSRAAEEHVTPERLTAVVHGLTLAMPSSSAAPMDEPFSASPRIHLPEQTSLFQALTTGTARPLDRPDREAAAARLHRAYEQLVDLVGPARGVRSRRDVDDLLAWSHRAPARLLFEWPSAMADAVDRFGSTLADAIRLAGPAASLREVDELRAGDCLQTESVIDRTRAFGHAWDAQLAPAILVWQWTLAFALTIGGDAWLTRTAVSLLRTSLMPAPADRPQARLTPWIGRRGHARGRVPFLPGFVSARAISGLVAAEATTAEPASGEVELQLGLSEDGHDALTTVCTIEPESLLARGHPRAHFVSTLSDRDVLLGHSDGSGIAVVSGSGEVGPDDAWPMPVRASISLGTRGRLAWHFPDAPRLLHRDASGRLDVIELPVCVFDALAQPDGSVCLATDSGLWTWTPGGAARPLAPGPWLACVYPHGDGLRACARPSRDDAGRWAATTDILEWKPGDAALRTVTVRPGTAPFSVAEWAGWRAEAWLDGCIVRLVRGDGREFWLACSGPRSLAWAGSTLYVATVAGEVLRFPEVTTRLANA